MSEKKAKRYKDSVLVRLALERAIQWELTLADSLNVRDEECQEQRKEALSLAKQFAQYKKRRFKGQTV